LSDFGQSVAVPDSGLSCDFLKVAPFQMDRWDLEMAGKLPPEQVWSGNGFPEERESEMLSDLKYAWRQLRKSPGFAVTAVVTLALGIGATTAIFTMFDQVLLRVLPVEKPQELVRFWWHGNFRGNEPAVLAET
jgi:hypothetical protein